MDASVIELYEQLANAPDERTRARLIAEALQALSERFPHLDHLATCQHLTETELKLLREIEQVRLETEHVRAELKESELKLSKEIEQVRADLSKEIEQVRSDLRVRIEQAKSETVRWVAGLWLAQTALIAWLILRAAS